MKQQKQQMNRCSAGSFEPPTGHVVPIAAVGMVLRRWSFDRATIRQRRRSIGFIRAADGWLLAIAAMVDCCLWLCFDEFG